MDRCRILVVRHYDGESGWNGKGGRRTSHSAHVEGLVGEMFALGSEEVMSEHGR